MRRCCLALCAPVFLVLLMQAPGEGAAPPPRQIVIPAPKTLKELRLLEAKIQETLKKILPATVGVGGGGSGVIVSKDGIIVSVAHVTQKAGKEVTITFPNGKQAKAKTLGNYRTADASLLQLTGKGPWPYTELGKSTEVKGGQWCLAVGYPVSFQRGQRPPVRIGRVLRQTDTVVVSDCPIMGGDSGGPLFDLEGRVIGVNSRVSGSMTGNVHVAIDIYHKNWKRLLDGEDWGTAGGGRNRNSLEPTALPVPEVLAPVFRQRSNRQASQLERNNDQIREAFREAVAPVSKSIVRLLVDDKPVALGTIITAEGLIVSKATNLKGKVMCKLPDGKLVEATIVGKDTGHDLALLEVKSKGLTPITWSKGEPPAQGYLVAAAGETGKALAVGMITNEPRQFRLSENPNQADRPYLGISPSDGKGGLRISAVRSGTPAEKAGLKTGDLISKVGETAVKNSDQLAQALRKYKAGQKVGVVVQRGEKTETLDVTLGKLPAELARAPYDRWGGGPFSERRFGFPKVLPHDTVLNPNDCGGPLVDTNGRAVGLNISRSLRISTYALLPADVEAVVKKLLAERGKTS